MRDTPAKLGARFQEMALRGGPIIGAAVGSGNAAILAEDAGVDFIIIYHAGRFKGAGKSYLPGLLPYGDANQIVMEMADEIVPLIEKTPLLVGVCSSDPFRLMEIFLRELKALGIAGVHNFPTVGLIDGCLREDLEEANMGYGLEIQMIRKSHEMGMFTCSYVFNEEDASRMANAGADLLVVHLGLAVQQGKTRNWDLNRCQERIERVYQASHQVNPGTLILCHGGPLDGPEEVRYLLERSLAVQGFLGYFNPEEALQEDEVSQQIREYKSILLKAR